MVIFNCFIVTNQPLPAIQNKPMYIIINAHINKYIHINASDSCLTLDYVRVMNFCIIIIIIIIIFSISNNLPPK